MTARIRLVLLWHMHQPDYRLPGDPLRAAMPWTRLHAAKDYVDIVELLAAREDVHMAVNVVPVLLDQLADIGRGGTDPLEEAARAAARGDATDEHRALLLRFGADLQPKMLPTSRRLPQVVAAGAPGPQDVLDLAVLVHLAWTGPLLRREPGIAALIARDGGFSGADLDRLLDRIAARARETAERWAAPASRGTLEFSTTPYNHPILPLLCDLRAAEEARAGCSVEGIDYRRPAHAQLQVSRGVARAGAALGVPVRGMWPSEGAVSPAALEAIRAGAPGLRWLATDRSVLAKSLGRDDPAAMLRPWRVGGEGPAFFFRDTDLSDRIGFTYAGLPAEEAASDFLAGARRAASRVKGPATLCVFLDGENCWEFYEGGGEPFLRALVDALSAADDIVALTPSEALALSDDEGTTGTLPRLGTGSWIRGDLDTWAGHPEKNAAWRLLAGAADALDEARRAGRDVEAARDRLLRAEGSDWFWWLGDDHPTPWKAEFDALFRAHVRSVYDALGVTAPSLEASSIQRPPPTPAPIDAPFRPITPRVDGEGRSHFGWYGAARLPEGHEQGAMHAGTASPIRELQYGWDEDHLYLRLLPRGGRLDALLPGAHIEVILDEQPVDLTAASTAAGAVWEAAIPRALVPAREGALRIVLRGGDGAVVRVPARGPATLRPTPLERPSWTA